MKKKEKKRKNQNSITQTVSKIHKEVEKNRKKKPTHITEKPNGLSRTVLWLEWGCGEQK